MHHFSTDKFALRPMGDIQAVFRRATKSAISIPVSISGYHIAEAGANLISAACLHAASNGFTIVE